MTPLQKKFARAKAIRRAMQEQIAAEIGPGYKRLCNEALQDIVSRMADNQIRDAICYALQSDDLTQEEREELLQISKL